MIRIAENQLEATNDMLHFIATGRAFSSKHQVAKGKKKSAVQGRTSKYERRKAAKLALMEGKMSNHNKESNTEKDKNVKVAFTLTMEKNDNGGEGDFGAGSYVLHKKSCQFQSKFAMLMRLMSLMNMTGIKSSSNLVHVSDSITQS
jgi:hypothetical protein